MARAVDPDRWSDSQLLSAIADGSGAAFEAFYRRHLQAVIAFLVRESTDREAAADLAAEVFAAVLLAARRYRAQGDSAAPWVLAIARNKLRMSRRRGVVESRARRHLGFRPVALHDEDLDRIERMAAGGAGIVSGIVDRLPENERRAIQARIVDEKSYAEIAAELRCSEMVIRKRVSRGLARVRVQLEEADQGE